MSVKQIFLSVNYFFLILFTTAFSMLPTDFERTESLAYSNTQHTWLGQSSGKIQGDDTVNSTI